MWRLDRTLPPLPFLVTFVVEQQSVMLDYPPKIIMAFGETFSDEGEVFYKWLLENGYPELAALSSSIRGSNEATEWLLKNKFPQLAALDGAIDKKQAAYDWLMKYEFYFLAVFADAVNNKPDATSWLKKRGFDVYLRVAEKIRHFRDNQTFDYHKLHF